MGINTPTKMSKAICSAVQRAAKNCRFQNVPRLIVFSVRWSLGPFSPVHEESVEPLLVSQHSVTMIRQHAFLQSIPFGAGCRLQLDPQLQGHHPTRAHGHDGSHRQPADWRQR